MAWVPVNKASHKPGHHPDGLGKEGSTQGSQTSWRSRDLDHPSPMSQVLRWQMMEKLLWSLWIWKLHLAQATPLHVFPRCLRRRGPKRPRSQWQPVTWLLIYWMHLLTGENYQGISGNVTEIQLIRIKKELSGELSIGVKMLWHFCSLLYFSLKISPEEQYSKYTWVIIWALCI